MELGSAADWLSGLVDILGILVIPFCVAVVIMIVKVDRLEQRMQRGDAKFGEICGKLDDITDMLQKMQIQMEREHASTDKRIAILEKTGCDTAKQQRVGRR